MKKIIETKLFQDIKNSYHRILNTTSYQKSLKNQRENKYCDNEKNWEEKMITVIPKILQHYAVPIIDKGHLLSEKSEITREELYKLKEESTFAREKIQKLCAIITNHYKDNPEKLRYYFNSPSAGLAGLTTAAYFNLTGDINPSLDRYFGGMGATINDSPMNLKLDRYQFFFSKIGSSALENAVIYGGLFASEIIENKTKNLTFTAKNAPFVNIIKHSWTKEKKYKKEVK